MVPPSTAIVRGQTGNGSVTSQRAQWHTVEVTLASRIYTASHLTGSFVLRSGATSDQYFDKYRFESDPELLRHIAEALAPLVPPETDGLAGLELGGIPIVTALSAVTGLPAYFVRKAAKAYGTAKICEGGEVAGMRLTIVEDVVTTAGQVLLSARDLRDAGAEVRHALCVIDREDGGAAALSAIGITLHPLYAMSELVSP
jgi:orotate phosphoribosyltransferase